MKIEIIVDDKTDDLHIAVICRQLTQEIEKLLETLRMMNQQPPAKKNEETYLLDIADVIYIESIDRKCFIYTAKEIYESDFRLYWLYHVGTEHLLPCVRRLRKRYLSYLHIGLTGHPGRRFLSVFLYSEQISRMLARIDRFSLDPESIIVIGVNIFIALILFMTAFRKCRLS